jgi:mannitol/fructose-specific phosphotransferase system IIA component (Ntr-type)
MRSTDLDEKIHFNSIINRPVAVPNREFMLAQADKCEKFLKLFFEIAETRQFEAHVYALHDKFEQNGPTEQLQQAISSLTLRYNR